MTLEGLFFNEEHKTLRQSVRDWAKDKEADMIKADVTQKYDPNIIREMGEMGFLGVSVPEKYGGAGMDYISLGIVSEELEYIETALRVAISVHNGLNSLGLLQWANEEQKMKYLKPQAEGKRISTYGLTEPDAGSDVAGMKSHAKEDGDYYILNGEKMWISLANVADQFLTFAYTDKSKGHKGITAFIVEREFDGVTTGDIKDKLGVRSGSTGWINYQDVPVPKENVVGELGEGFKIAMTCLENGRYTVSAGSVGAAKRARDLAVQYAKDRKTFGVSIGEHQLIQRRLAHMQRGIDTAELLVYKAGWMKNQGIRNTRETAMAKWHATNVAWENADSALQIHGGNGIAGGEDGYRIEAILRNVRAALIYEGSNEIQELMAGQYAMGLRVDKPIRKELPKYADFDKL